MNLRVRPTGMVLHRECIRRLARSSFSQLHSTPCLWAGNLVVPPVSLLQPDHPGALDQLPCLLLADRRSFFSSPPARCTSSSHAPLPSPAHGSDVLAYGVATAGAATAPCPPQPAGRIPRLQSERSVLPGCFLGFLACSIDSACIAPRSRLLRGAESPAPLSLPVSELVDSCARASLYP